MENFDDKKLMLFKTAFKLFVKYDDTTDNLKAYEAWREYCGIYKAIEIFGWVTEFVTFCKKNGWDVLIP